ncbi:MAG: flavodoxin family protein [Deltaproteobacteria bacterium]|nr:flavodoxin family protein [Deltaproteobacteria bacterium]MBW2674008.1 flavodoxin family protein [Deltaproteobacteria bacterium]
MKILNVYGSSIEGSSAAIAKRFVEKAGRFGAEIQSFKLGGAHNTSCKECMSCKTTTDRCVIQDDITTIFDSLVTSDVLVLSTGIYSGEVSGNMSIFESRLFSFLKPDFETNPDASRLPSGKKLVFIQTQGGASYWHTDIYQRYEALFKKLGFSDVFIIHGDCIDHPYDIGDDIMNLAEEIAEKCLLET